MENVYTALSGLHELYMMCYVKMLPVYCVSCAFFSALFLPSPLFYQPLLSRAQTLLLFPVANDTVVVEC